MTEREKMCSGQLYNPTDRRLMADRLRARILADRYNRTRAFSFLKRARIIKKLFPNGGKNAFFEPSIRTEYGYNVTFGDNFYMNFDCQLLDVAPITIGDNVLFGPRVVVATPCHPLLPEERRAYEHPDGFYDLEYAKPVEIGSDVWVAAGVTICGGVKIGSGSVIAAGSVVVRDIPPCVLAAGVPCKPIREITKKDGMFEALGITLPEGAKRYIKDI